MKDELKQEAIKRLEILKLDSTIINDFKDNNKVYVSKVKENGTEFIFDSEVMDMIKIFEQEKTTKIYHVLLYKNDIYMLSVHTHKETWKYENAELKKGFVTAVICDIIDNGIIGLIAKDIGIETEAGKIKKVVL